MEEDKKKSIKNILKLSKNDIEKNIVKSIFDYIRSHIIAICICIFAYIAGLVTVANSISPRVSALEQDTKPIAEIVQQIPEIKKDIQQIKSDIGNSNTKIDKVSDRVDAIYNLLIKQQ